MRAGGHSTTGIVCPQQYLQALLISTALRLPATEFRQFLSSSFAMALMPLACTSFFFHFTFKILSLSLSFAFLSVPLFFLLANYLDKGDREGRPDGINQFEPGKK